MKKFTKVCLITALVLAIVGVLCFIIGGVLGVHPFQSIRKAVSFQDYEKNFDEDYDLEDFSLLESYEADEISSLSFDMDLGALVIRFTDSDTCRILADKGSYTKSLKTEIDNHGLLKIEESSNYIHSNVSFLRFASIWGNENWHNEITRVIVELPEKEYHTINGKIELGVVKMYDLKCRKLIIDVDAGAFYSEGSIDGEDAEIKVGMGKADLETVNFKQMELDADMGDIRVDSILSNTLDVNANMGNIQLYHTEAKVLTADCDMGNIDIEFVGKPEDYSVTYDVDMGDVNIEDYVRNNEGTAKYRAELDCDMGNIDVCFLGDS